MNDYDSLVITKLISSLLAKTYWASIYITPKIPRSVVTV